MKVRAVQFAPVLGNIARNLESHLERIETAIGDGIELIVFPELSLSGYQLKDIAAETALNPDSPELAALCCPGRQIDIVIGAPLELTPGLISNCAIHISGGAITHIHRKVQLPNYGMFEEQMIFKPGDSFISIPVKGFRVGLLICREILFPIHAYLYYLQGTDLLIGISNSPFRGLEKDRFSSFAYWETMGTVFAFFYHQNYLFVNRTGFEDGIGFGGGSFYAAAGRGIVERAPLIEDAILDAEIDGEEVRRSRLASCYRRDEHPRLILKELERIINAGHE